MMSKAQDEDHVINDEELAGAIARERIEAFAHEPEAEIHVHKPTNMALEEKKRLTTLLQECPYVIAAGGLGDVREFDQAAQWLHERGVRVARETN